MSSEGFSQKKVRLQEESLLEILMYLEKNYKHIFPQLRLCAFGLLQLNLMIARKEVVGNASLDACCLEEKLS